VTAAVHRAAFHRAILLCLLAGAPFAACAERAHYALDPVHTRVLFSVSHAGFSQALGTVSGSTGTLDFDPDDLRSARVEASVPLPRLELGDEKWNRAAKKLLEADAHPRALFVSTRVEPIDATHATVIGMLTLNGISQEVRLDVTFNQLRRHPLPPFRRTAGFSATATLSRKAFGITDWPSVIGDAVQLRIEAEAVRARGSVAEDLDENLPPPEALQLPPDENLPPPPQPGDASEPPASP
jgi:polyisoprenoid-binding protein YceI